MVVPQTIITCSHHSEINLRQRHTKRYHLDVDNVKGYYFEDNSITASSFDPNSNYAYTYFSPTPTSLRHPQRLLILVLVQLWELHDATCWAVKNCLIMGMR